MAYQLSAAIDAAEKQLDELAEKGFNRYHVAFVAVNHAPHGIEEAVEALNESPLLLGAHVPSGGRMLLDVIIGTVADAIEEALWNRLNAKAMEAMKEQQDPPKVAQVKDMIAARRDAKRNRQQ